MHRLEVITQQGILLQRGLQASFLLLASQNWSGDQRGVEQRLPGRGEGSHVSHKTRMTFNCC